jgi:hypothetical protein
MIPGFSVKFVINRILGSYKIQITDTTDYTGVSTAYGFYRIEYPDGIHIENSDPLNPDFEIGQNFSEFNLRLKNSLTMAGQYRIIQKTTTDSDEIETTKVIIFSFIEPELKLTNTSNLAIPSVTFTDSTNYNLGFYTEVISRVISSNFPAHLPFFETVATTTGNVLTMLYSGNYYEGVYQPALSSSVILTGTGHTIEWIKSASFSFDVRKLLSYTQILSYVDVAKNRYDQSKGTTNESKERENYQLVTSLIDHIQFKAVSVSQGVAELMAEIQDLIYKITCTYTDIYNYSDNPIPPIDENFFIQGVPLNRVLTINGVAQDLTQDRTWNVGTVTSVDIQVPTWMTVVGGPITESGVFQLGLSAGYYIPTTDDVARWDIDTFVTGVSVTGTSVKTISLTRNDGVVLTAQWNDIDTFPVTSVNGKIGDVVLVTDDISEGAFPINLWFTQTRARNSISLTTNGNSGGATYSSSTGVFNIPNYTLVGLGGVPFTRELTINGVSFDLSANRTWNVGTVTQINTGAGLIGGPITGSGTISHADTSNLLGLIGGSGISSITVDEFGHVTAVSTASYVPTSRNITINGQTFDLSQDRTYAVNIGVSSISATSPISVSASTGAVVVSHNNSGVTPGTYNSFTVDEKGHVTAASNQLTGHVIQDNGVSMTQRTNLNFIRMTVQDNVSGNATNVTRPPSVTISTTPPTANLLEGDEWINDNTWKKYAWYDSFWAEVGVKSCSTYIDPSLITSADGVVQIGTYIQSGGNITVNNDWIWKINQTIYQKLTSTLFSITPTDIGFTRIDLIYGDSNNEILLVSGSSITDPDPAIPPTVPFGGIGLFLVFVNNSGISGFQNFALSSFVRYDVNNQGLSLVQRQNARTNIQALSRDTNDSRSGTLDQNATMRVTNPGGRQTTLSGDLITVRTGEDGTASSNMLDVRNTINLGGITVQKRGSTTIRGRGDSVTGYFILRLQNNSSTPTTVFEVAGNSPWAIGNSAGAEFLTRRQELVINYSETVSTVGTINNLLIAIDTKLLILTACDDLTGVVGSQGRLLRIEARVASRIIRNESGLSTAANRFSVGTDLTINAGEVYQFIYTNSRWRRIL